MKCAGQVFSFLKELECFDYALSCLDRIWNVYFPNQPGQWNHLQVTKYGNTFFLVLIDGELPDLEVGSGKKIGVMDAFGNCPRPFLSDGDDAAWEAMLESACVWLKKVEKDWIRSRLLARDHIGIVPGYASLHRASQRFPKHQQVYDVLHYRTLGRYKRRLDPFIVWEPLPVLRPNNFSLRPSCS